MQREFDVALSFAGEDREHAEKLADLLRKGGYKVLYDKFEQANLWGKNLYDHLTEVYRDKALYCVVFLSESYARKRWPQHERQSAQARAFTEEGEYILPVLLDEAEIPEVLNTVGYLDLREMPIGEVYQILKTKLSATPQLQRQQEKEESQRSQQTVKATEHVSQTDPLSRETLVSERTGRTMPRTIEEGFRDFHKKLTPSVHETSAAKRHRASIKQCIESNFGLERFWRTGSFGNGTSISGHSDVDYMASIPKKRQRRNSSDSLSDLRSALARRFPNTGVRTSCPAVVVPFGTDAKETTEVTPAFLSDSSDSYNVYGIPDCSGRWMPASPDAHNDYVRSVDQSLSHKVKPLIRFIKAWKYFQCVPISSFYLELRVAKYASEERAIVYSIDIKNFFKHLDGIGLARIRDPKGISGYISPCKSDNYLAEAKSKVSTALSRATKAREAEASGDIKEAFDWWDKLFGGEFPSYSK